MSTEKSNKSPVLISREWSYRRLILIVLMLIGVGAGVIATLTLRDVRGRAEILKPNPSGFDTPIIPPKSSVSAPYIRLVVPKNIYGLSTEIPVDVYLLTKEVPIVEASIYLTYDKNILEFDESKSTKTDIFAVVDATENEDGFPILTLFSNPDFGQKEVQNEREVKIATLQFKSKTLVKEATEISIDFIKGDNQKSSLFAAKNIRNNPDNLLESVEGVTLKIAP